ncbi:unnamed protein product, partial [Prorocentrum cordatum]
TPDAIDCADLRKTFGSGSVTKEGMSRLFRVKRSMDDVASESSSLLTVTAPKMESGNRGGIKIEPRDPGLDRVGVVEHAGLPHPAGTPSGTPSAEEVAFRNATSVAPRVAELTAQNVLLHEQRLNAMGSQRVDEASGATESNDPELAKLHGYIADGGFPIQSTMANHFRELHKKGTEAGDKYRALSRGEAKQFRLDFLKSKAEEREAILSQTTTWSKTDFQGCHYRTAAKIFEDMGGRSDPMIADGVIRGVEKCIALGPPWIQRHPQTGIMEYVIIQFGWVEKFNKAWSEYIEMKNVAPDGQSGSAVDPNPKPQKVPRVKPQAQVPQPPTPNEEPAEVKLTSVLATATKFKSKEILRSRDFKDLKKKYTKEMLHVELGRFIGHKKSVDTIESKVRALYAAHENLSCGAS